MSRINIPSSWADNSKYLSFEVKKIFSIYYVAENENFPVMSVERSLGFEMVQEPRDEISKE